MYNYELITLLEKVLMKSYQMKNGEHAFHCPFCNHHKKKLQEEIGIKETSMHMMDWLCHFLKKKIDLYTKIVVYYINV